MKNEETHTLALLECAHALPPYSVQAHNFAGESPNSIHRAIGAARLGFAGALVPGVALYAYMTEPIVREFGEEWIKHGSLKSTFVQPFYEGEMVTVHAQILKDNPLHVRIDLLNPCGALCAAGQASMYDHPVPIDASLYSRRPMPATKFPPRVEALPAGTLLGALRIDPGLGICEEGSFGLLEAFREPLPIYRGSGAPWHPAVIPMHANWLIEKNVEVEMWIHTASQTQYYALPVPEEEIWMCGFVQESFITRGHHMATFDLAAVGENQRILAHIIHKTIICPAQLV